MLEVVGIKGVVHIGQISSGISGAIRLAQGGRVSEIMLYYSDLKFFVGKN